MSCLITLTTKTLFSDHVGPAIRLVQSAGCKYFLPPVKTDRSEWPEHRKLRIQPKVPPLINAQKHPKMMKELGLMRGPEPFNNFLIYNQYGIQALTGGRMTYEHFECVRYKLLKKQDAERMFFLWRIDAPWQSVSRKSPGKRMGGGKAPVHHFVTPFKANRIILEMGGDLCGDEAKQLLTPILSVLPFKAQFVSKEIMMEQKRERLRIENENQNPYTMEYIIKNKMGGCGYWISPYDEWWFGRYR